MSQLQAKGIIERDLRKIRAAHEAREHTSSSPVQGHSPKAAVSSIDAKLEESTDLRGSDLPDTAMLDTLDGDIAAQATALDPTTFTAIGDNATRDNADVPITAIDSEDALKVDTAAQEDAQPSIARTDGEIGQAKVGTTQGTDGTTAPNSAFDFDSIFGEGGNTDPFDLDFGDSSAGNATGEQAVNMDDLFNEIGASTEDFSEFGVSATNPTAGTSGNGAAEDIDSLLPGIGSYVNVENNEEAAGMGGEDFAMIDLPTDEGNSGPAANNASTEPRANRSNAPTGTKTTTDDANGGLIDMDNMDDIFGDLVDVGNMEGTNIDDFDWNM